MTAPPEPTHEPNHPGKREPCWAGNGAIDSAAPVAEVVLVMTYMVVVFSILVQGLTIGRLSRRWIRAERGPTGEQPGHERPPR